MKTYSIVLFLFSFVCLHSQSPTWEWAKRTGSTGDNFGSNSGNEAINDTKVDKQGNIYAVGNFFANTAFQNAQLFGQTTPLPFAKDDAYLIKYNSCGQLLWWRRMGGGNNDGATSLVIDNSGNIVVTGYCISSPAVFSGGANTYTTNMSVFGNQQFIAKFDTIGTLLSVNTYSFGYNKILLSSQGNYFITNGPFAAIINTTGVVTNTLAFCSPSTPSYPTINGVVLDRNDNIYLAGGFNNTVTLNSNVTLPPTPSTVFAGMAANSLIIKANSNGIIQWYQRGFANGAGDVLGGVTVDTSQSQIILGGRVWNNSSVFGYVSNSGIGTYANPIYFMNAFNGSLISAITASTNLGGSIHPYKTDRDNNFYFKGRINGWLSIANSTVAVVGPASNLQNVIAKFNGSNNLVYLNMLPQAGSPPANDNVFGLDICEQGNVYICGMFGGTLDSAGTAVNILGGQEDGFVAKFGFPCGSTLTTLSPLAPTNLNASYQGTLTNLVNWVDNSNYETGFELWYNGPTPTFSLLATLAPNTTTYTHPGLSYSTTYCYAVRAVNNIGPSVFTNTDCATTPAQTAPQAPTNLTALNSGTLVNNVNWVDNSFDETGFELHYTISPSATYSLLATLPANTTTYSHAGLNYTTTYCYKALATNTVGVSAFTNTDCATTPQQPAPNAPTSLTAANTGTLINNVAWVDNSTDETAFELWYHDANPTFSLLATLPANTTSYTHTGLSYTTNYCYKANAVNAGGQSAFTNTDCATTPGEIDETGIGKHTAAVFNLYPNPSKGQVFVEFLSVWGDLKITVTDAIGRVIVEENVSVTNSDTVHKIEMSGCKGVYFVKVETTRGSKIQKIVME